MFLTNMRLQTALARRLAPIMDGIRGLFATHAARTPALQGLTTRVYNYLGQIVMRLDRLAARVQSGTLRPARPRAPRPRPRKPTASPRLPVGNFWLIRCAPPTGSYACNIETFLQDPALADLIAAAPQAGRLLRPLYRAFGIKIPENLKLPPRPPRPKPAKPAPPPPKPIHALVKTPEKWRIKPPRLRFSSA